MTTTSPASIQVLLEQKAAIERQIAALQNEGRKEGLAKIRSIMAEYGFTMEDIAGLEKNRASKKSDSRSKVAVKYTDGKGKNWTGRGMKPLWLRAEIEAGKPLESFLVQTAQ